jgi:negative regulator of sigma E activity
MIDDPKTESVGRGENLSALLDGELPPEQTGFLLKRIERDAELRATLLRYQLVGDTLRGERVRARPDFALRVSAAIAAEPPLPLPEARPAIAAATSRVPARSRRAPAWLKPLAGLAVAASVASVAVVVLQREPGGAAPAVVASTGTPAAASMGSAPAPTTPVSPALAPSSVAMTATLTGEPASYVTPPATAATGIIPPAQLANYVVAHAEYSSPLGRRNVLTGLLAADAPVAPEAASAAVGTPAATSR